MGIGQFYHKFEIYIGFPEVTYECTVVTGDADHAGTDMKIMLSASGDKGTTTPVELEKASDRFERAREDNIRVGCNYSYFKWLRDGLNINVDVYIY